MKYVYLFFCLVFLNGCNESIKQRDTFKNIGLITKIGNCQRSKKSETCDIYIDKLLLKQVRVDYFPDSDLFLGDFVFYKTEVFNDKIIYLSCKNNRCQSTGVCYWWMPCFDKEKSI